VRLVAAAVASAALLAAHGAALADTSLPTLYVNYTMSCTFGMTDAWGKTLTAIAPGAYKILVTSPVPFASVNLVGVNDMTACKGAASFQLTGPGVSLATTMDDGDADSAFLYATFQAGSTYSAVDTAQPAVAHFSFTTTAVPAPAVPSPPAVAAGPGEAQAQGGDAASAPAAVCAGCARLPSGGTLTATVSAAGGATLTYRGRAVTALRAGRYTIRVIDGSRRRGFVLQELHRRPAPISGAGFTGRRTVTIELTKGRWSFSPSLSGGKTYFIVLD
jgi:hypothetical protein